MTALGSWVVQKGIVTTLKATAPFMALVQGVFDQVREGQAYPYVVVGEGSESLDETMGAGGHAVIADVEIWTQDGSSTTATTGSAGYKQGMAIAELAVSTLQASLTVDSHAVIDVRLQDLERERIDAKTRVVRPKILVLIEDP